MKENAIGIIFKLKFSINRYFGKKCLSLNSFIRYCKNKKWICRKCQHDELINKMIIRTVDNVFIYLYQYFNI